MIEVLFAILMVQNGDIIEYVATKGMSDCLTQKRIIERQIGENQQGIYMQCKEVTAEVEIAMGDRKKILKLLPES